MQLLHKFEPLRESNSGPLSLELSAVIAIPGMLLQHYLDFAQLLVKVSQGESYKNKIKIFASPLNN